MWIRIILEYDPEIILGSVWLPGAWYRTGDHVQLKVIHEPPIAVPALTKPSATTAIITRTFSLTRFVKGRGWNQQEFFAIVTDQGVDYWREIAGFKEGKR